MKNLILMKALQEKKEPLLSALGGAEANFQNATARREKLAADYKAQSDALDEKARGAGFADRNDCKVWYARVKEEERMEKSISDYETELKATETNLIIDEVGYDRLFAVRKNHGQQQIDHQQA